MNNKKNGVRRKVIGVLGRNGSGKDALLRYLAQRCGLTVLSLGDAARELAHLEEMPPSRPHLQEVSQKYLDKYGEDFFIKIILKEIDQKSLEKVGISGIRTQTDVDGLRHHFGANFLLVHVQVNDPHLRFERLRQRGEARDPQTYEEFQAQEKSEKDLFDVEAASRRADVTLSNDGSLEDFHREIDRLISTHQFFQGLDCEP